MATTAGATLSNYDEVLKTFYLEGAQSYLNHASILSDIIEVNEKDVSGSEAEIENHYGRSAGTGSRGDAAALPAAKYQKFKTSKVYMKHHYGRVDFTGPSIAATKNSRGAYAKVIDTEIKGIVEDLKKETNRQMWGCGWSMLGRIAATTDSAIVLQKKYTGNANGANGFGSTFGGKYLDKRTDGNVIIESTAVGNGSANNSGDYTLQSTDIAVTALTKGTSGTDTLANTDPGTVDINDWIHRPSALLAYASMSATTGIHRKEMMGLRGIVTDEDLDNIVWKDATNTYTGLLTNDTLQGLAVGSYSWFKAIVDTHSSGRYAGQRALTLDNMQLMFDMVEEVAGKDYGPNLIITTRALRREYLSLVQADNLNVNTMELDGGWSALDYNGVPLVVDNDAIDGEVYFLTTKDLQMFRSSDYEWMQKDGSVLSKVSGYDMYEAVLFRYAELGTLNRQTSGVLCDLAYTKGAAEGYGG